MIVVTGATGNVGRPLVATLAAAGAKVRAVSRAVTAADVPDGVEYVRGDLARAGDLTAAFDGAESLFLLTSGEFLGTGGDLGEVMTAARAGGVRRVVLLSSQGVGTGDHPSDLEDSVKQSGVEWTMLRPGNFASNALQWADSVRTERVIAAPFADAAFPLIDPEDIAAVAAAVLLGDGHDGKIYELTGPVAISPRQQAEAIGDAVGEPVRFVEETRAEATARMVRFMPEPVVEATLNILSSPGALGQVRPDVERILGRPARSFGDWVARNVAAFR
ncbi:NmrA family protein [Nocardia nova SH22a]|uniref:NmrA family protein n=1 Tax=Nocardia nova SH22a TaxID=1415166 RepID=W5TWG9_9NOCA|nr:NAD(P)H-binding protein [Nocardia nova]AHH21521.1 NmrA family protein [Nocardia nova SH22a]